MRHFIAAASAITIAVILPMAGAANAAPKPPTFSSCAKLILKFPNGVARNAADAQVAVAHGYASPSVNAGIYRVNGARLDRDRDGIACQLKLS